MGLLDVFRRKTPPPAERSYRVVVVSDDGLIPSFQGAGSGDIERDLASALFFYAAATANAEACALAPLPRRKVDGRWVADRKLDLPLLDIPCIGACARFDTQDLVEWAVLCCYFRGRAYARIVDTSLGVSLEPLQVDGVEVQRDKSGRITRYIYGGAVIEPADMLHISLASPSVTSDGMGPREALARVNLIDYLAQERQAWMLRNKAEPGVVITLQGGLTQNAETRAQLVAEIEAAYAGASKSGKPMVLGGNATITPGLNTPRGDYVDLSRFGREAVLAVTRTPPPILGVYDAATMNNFAHAIKIWWALALEPMLRNIYGAINAQVIYPRRGRNVQLWYDLTSSQFALDLLADRVKIAGDLVERLGYPANAAAARVGLDLERFEALDLPNVKFTIAGRTNESK